MTDRWARIGELFDQAAAVPVEERETFIRSASESDEIKDEVRSLLAAHETATDFLETGPAPAEGDVGAASSRDVDPTLPHGMAVGPYRVTRVIGRGGMGVVYEAQDTRLHRRVALKALPHALAADETERHRLRREARAAAALQHPGIATVYALEEIDGQIFISSEYLEGETLREEIRRGPLPIGRALSSAFEIARALCVAHEHGVVHRDLKPENIIRTRAGTLKILDFGLAQIDETVQSLASKTRLTKPGMIVGTPPYMAPEQLLGRPTDFRVDHFAFGVLLYELCTGRHPFGDHSLPSTIARILASAPDPVPLSAGVPTDVWAVISRCLEKDPVQRFATTRDLVTTLDALASTTATAPANAPAPASDVARVESDARSGVTSRTKALQWWRFHQFAAAAVYWAMVWPVWHIHSSVGRVGLFFFFATLAAVVIAANLRLHLWFSSRVYPEDLPAQRGDVSRWIWWADVLFAALLIIGGFALPQERAGWAALLISVGVGATVAFVFIEPATTRAAFRGWYQL